MYYYRIYDTKECCYIGKRYESSKAAYRRADKLDMEYRAIRYVVQFFKGE